MEEENYLDKPASAIGADILRNINPTAATVATLGSTGALTQAFDPRLVGSAAEKQLIKRGQASLMNPTYQRFAGRVLPTALRNQGAMKLLGTAAIPATAAVAASDIVQDEAGRIGGEMQRLSDIEGSQIQKAGGDLAERLRKLNIAYPEFGGEEGITMGNLDEFFAANPDFSGIGDITLPGEEPRVAPMVQQTQTAPMAPISGSKEMTGFTPQFEGQTLGQFLRYEDTPEQATMQALDPQGRLRQFTADGQLAPSESAFEAASAAREARIGAPKVGLGTAVSDNATGKMSMSDFRSLAKEELGPGVPSQAIAARARQLMGAQQAKDAAAELTAELTQAQIEKAKRPRETRAPSAAELGLAINQQMAALQAKLDAGEELTPDELVAYRAGNSYIQMQSKFGETPFQMPGDNENTNAENVELLDRQGRKRSVPADQVEKALESGYTRV